jgi:hypothetical protein
VTAAEARLVGNKFDPDMVKGGKPLTVIIPDHVVKMLNDLPRRDTVDPVFLLEWACQIKSETARWQRNLKRLNKFLSMVNYAKVTPKPLKMTTDPEISGLPPDAWPRHLAIAAVEFAVSAFAMWVEGEQEWPSQKGEDDDEPDDD